MNATDLTPKMIETIEALRGRSAQLGNNGLNGNTVRALIRRGVIVREQVNPGSIYGFCRITLAPGI